MQRIRLGFYANQMNIEYTNRIRQSALHRCAQDPRIDIFAFVGKYSTSTLESTDRFSQFNQIDSFINHNNLDVLILLSGTFLLDVFHKNVADFVARLDIPVISIGLTMEGCSNILVDNKIGIDKIVDHFAQHHGRKKIAFVTGPMESNQEAKDRFAAYKKALTRNKLPFDGSIVYPGNFLYTAGAKLAKTITKGKLWNNFDSIIFSNDEMAIHFMKNFKHLDKIPSEFLISGFDDLSEASIYDIPLTTVGQPFEKIGELAVDEALYRINGGNGPRNHTLEVVPVFRSSCGCGGDKATISFADYTNAFKRQQDGVMLVNNLNSGMNSMLHKLRHGGGDLGKMLGTFLKANQIRECYISLLSAFGKNQNNAEMEMIVGYDTETTFARGSASPQIFSGDKLFPNDIFQDKPGKKLAVYPLFSHEHFYGTISFDISGMQPSDSYFLEISTMLISNFLQTYLVVKDNIIIEKELRLALEQIRVHTRILEKESQFDALTGLYNRKCFNLLAENVMELSLKMGNDMVVFFADMDYLKNINDTWGHQEGDAAIKACGELLRKTFRKNDVIGRVGGDEFIIASPAIDAETASALIQRLESALRQYNKQSGKPYALGITIGWAVSDAAQPASIEALIRQADAELYRLKKARPASGKS